uniref:Peptidase S1 domain-containing protein n=1 Tax=Heliothis virescens TaxID=7102 RepID=A0A2A4K803_HELVI
MLFLFTNTVFGVSFYIQKLWDKLHPKDDARRVQHGEDVVGGKYPYVIIIAGITSKDEVYRIATGSIITPTWTLTAAHVFTNMHVHGNDTFVVWYDKFTESPAVTKAYTQIKEIVKHPGFRDIPFVNFQSFYSNNDICLLKVNKVNLPAYGKLSPVDRTTLLGLATKFFGAGKTNKTGKDIFHPIQEGHGLIIKCGPPISSWSSSLLCVSPPCANKQLTPNTGDSGGPFMIDDKIIGTFSLRYFGYTSTAWNAFCPVDLYIDWIHDVINRGQ